MTKNSHDPSRRSMLLASAAALGAGMWSLPGRAADNELRLGWIKPLNGPLASTFEGYFQAAEIGFEEINAAGGILGRKLVKVEVDDQANPANEPIVMRKLADAGVQILVGPIGSSQSLAAFQIGGPRKMLQATYSSADEVGDGTRFPYHYGFSSPGLAQVKRHAEYLQAMGIKKAGILTEDSAAGASIRESIQQELKARRIEVVSDQVFNLKTQDMTPFLRKLRADGALALDTHLSNLNDMTQLRIGLKRLNWTPPIVGGAGLLLSGTVPDGAMYKDIYAATYRALTYTDTEKPPGRVIEFARKLAAKDISPTIIGTAVTSPFYDFLHALKKGAEATKSLEPDAIRKYWDSGADLGGLFGRLTFTPARHFGYETDAMAMAVVASEDEPFSKEFKGIFRRRAPAVA
ncbi:amino acid ABC transporter substrate-binding protein [Ramlibacter sp. G-1-2-2]|uniref:Amino acid ABC transporter substrate-binding protein n=1 Tax=Ramlibacter agri TaxID=2728837 RepID=A0A848HB17_9BURK|nr:ABC transporter substrate-binding protein [Ramlibacter agri]NML47242.1 amino acid ABC transporter substrate-binding protein [Ramlibacter agri]